MNGVDKPLMQLRESRLAPKGKSRQPASLRVFGDRVECTTPGLMTRGTTDTIRYEQVAQVIVDRRVAWSTLAVETNGGGGFSIGGLKKDDADAAKALIDARVAELRVGITGTATAATTSSSLVDQLAQLSSLRASGALTDEEFVAAKAQLLGSRAS